MECLSLIRNMYDVSETNKETADQYEEKEKQKDNLGDNRI